MGSELICGISTTNGATTNPLMTFVWDAIESGNQLEVTVRFGTGANTNNSFTAAIPVGSTEPVRIAGTSPDNKVQVGGKVTAAWANGNRSYVVTFSGQMLVGRVNNAYSSDLNGTPGDSAPIIVAAYLAA